jgi:hypothetical protein
MVCRWRRRPMRRRGSWPGEWCPRDRACPRLHPARPTNGGRQAVMLCGAAPTARATRLSVLAKAVVASTGPRTSAVSSSHARTRTGHRTSGATFAQCHGRRREANAIAIVVLSHLQRHHPHRAPLQPRLHFLQLNPPSSTSTAVCGAHCAEHHRSRGSTTVGHLGLSRENP